MRCLHNPNIGLQGVILIECCPVSLSVDGVALSMLPCKHTPSSSVLIRIVSHIISSILHLLILI